MRIKEIGFIMMPYAQYDGIWKETNWVHSSRETEVRVAAMMILHGNRVIDGKDEIEKVLNNQGN